MTNAKEDLKFLVGDLMVTHLADEIFTVEGTPMLCHKLAEGSFKNKPGIPGAEFMLANTYVGKRGELIFIFSPVDAQEFTVEVKASAMDTTFPSFGPIAGEKLSIDSEKTDFIVKALFKRESKAQADAKAAAEAAEANRAAQAYNTNPLFGRF